jgi:hypothetical protein
MTMAFFAIVSRIRRSASSRIDCFDICPHLPSHLRVRAYNTRLAHVECKERNERDQVKSNGVMTLASRPSDQSR